MDDVLPASSVAWTHSTKVECSRWPITLDRSPGAVCLMIAQYAVQIECGADQCKMSEGLRKIAQSLSLRTYLFCVKPEMIRITQHSLKHKPGLVELFRDSLTRSRKRLHKPERAHVESALLTRKSVNARLRRVSVDQAVTDETAVAWALKDRIQGAEHPRIVWGHEKYQRHD